MVMIRTDQLPRFVLRSAARARQAGLACFDPIDWLSRAVNGKCDFPSVSLRRHVGPLRGYEASAMEVITALKLLCNLKSNHRILDIGCGSGKLAIFLREFLAAGGGEYYGEDLHKPSIEWARRHLENSHVHFRHMNVKNSNYNPRGSVRPQEYVFDYGKPFDIMVLNSVFTHMLERETESYLSQIGNLLGNDGTAYMTFFLLNEWQNKLEAEGRNKIEFLHGSNTCRHQYKNNPYAAVAYDEAFVLRLLRKYGLEMPIPIIPGTWSGSDRGTFFQEVVIVRKSKPGNSQR